MQLNINDMNKISTFLFSLLLIFKCVGQEEQPTKLFISKSPKGKFYFDYSLSKGETAYSISQKFKQPLISIQSINEDKNLSELGSSEVIKIPFSNEILIDSTESSSTALVYITQPKETLYSIGKRYFQLEIEEIRNLNNLENHQLDVGQEIIIGYTNLDRKANMTNVEVKTFEEIHQDHSEPIIQSSVIPKNRARDQFEIISEDNDHIKKEYTISELIEMIDDEKESENFIEFQEAEEDDAEEFTLEKGIAYTENVKIDGDDLFVLHPYAKIGSEVEITYPMLNTTIKAKVISDLPKELYPKNISIVISPSIAEALGAKDAQFRVEMKYITD